MVYTNCIQKFFSYFGIIGVGDVDDWKVNWRRCFACGGLVLVLNLRHFHFDFDFRFIQFWNL